MDEKKNTEDLREAEDGTRIPPEAIQEGDRLDDGDLSESERLPGDDE